MEMLRWRSAYAVPEGMTGTLHLAWYDPINTVANIGSPTHDGHNVRDNDATLSAAGGGLPGFTLEFTTAGPSENSDLIQKSYLAINDARYRDNFIVVAHPHTGIAETYEFRTNDDFGSDRHPDDDGDGSWYLCRLSLRTYR